MVVVDGYSSYNYNYYKNRFYSYYKPQIVSLINKQFKGEDINGESYVIYNFSEYKVIYTYFSLLKLNLTTITQPLSYFRGKFKLDDFVDTLSTKNYNIYTLLDLFEIPHEILTAE